MAKELVGALVPIFAGLLPGFWAARRGLMGRFNVRNLVALVVNIAPSCALFLIITNTSRAILQQQICMSLAMIHEVSSRSYLANHLIQSPKL